MRGRAAVALPALALLLALWLSGSAGVGAQQPMCNKDEGGVFVSGGVCTTFDFSIEEWRCKDGSVCTDECIKQDFCPQDATSCTTCAVNQVCPEGQVCRRVCKPESICGLSESTAYQCVIQKTRKVLRGGQLPDMENEKGVKFYSPDCNLDQWYRRSSEMDTSCSCKMQDDVTNKPLPTVDAWEVGPDWPNNEKPNDVKPKTGIFKACSIGLSPAFLNVPVDAFQGQETFKVTEQECAKPLSTKGPIDVTLPDCKVYTVTTTDEMKFSRFLMKTQPWWGKKAVAEQFATAVQDSLGLPNSDTPQNHCGVFFGPYFAFRVSKCLRNCPLPSPFEFPADAVGVWAKATEQTTTPPQKLTCYIPVSSPGVCYTWDSYKYPDAGPGSSHTLHTCCGSTSDRKCCEQQKQAQCTSIQEWTGYCDQCPTFDSAVDGQLPATQKECKRNVGPAPAMSIDCSNPPVATVSPIGTFPLLTPENQCRATARVVWEASTPGCPTPTSATQKVTLVDTVAPTLGALPNVRAKRRCARMPLSKLAASASDECDESLTKATVSDTYKRGFSPAPFCNQKVVVTWSAADKCGLTTTATAAYTIVPGPFKATAPPKRKFHCPAKIKAGRLGKPSPPVRFCSDKDPTLTLESGPSFETPADDAHCKQGGYTGTVRWVVKDPCNRKRTISSTFSIPQDTIAPAITAPAAADVCSASAAVPSVKATDKCGPLARASLTSTNSKLQRVPGFRTVGTVTRTYTATDGCNTASKEVALRVCKCGAAIAGRLLLDGQPPRNDQLPGRFTRLNKFPGIPTRRWGWQITLTKGRPEEKASMWVEANANLRTNGYSVADVTLTRGVNSAGKTNVRAQFAVIGGAGGGSSLRNFRFAAVCASNVKSVEWTKAPYVKFRTGPAKFEATYVISGSCKARQKVNVVLYASNSRACP